MAPLAFLPLDNLKSMVMDRRLHEAVSDASLEVLSRLTEHSVMLPCFSREAVRPQGAIGWVLDVS